MTSPRLRRLAADFQAIRSEYSGHPYVSAQPLGPLPPEGYRVSFRLAGLMLSGETPVETNQHVCEIRLPLGYPRDQPQVTPLTPLFHPNVADHYCIADYWAAGEGLVDVIAKVGDMIQYRVYNTKSPLNAVAAYWADQHPELFPIGNIELGQPELDIALRSERAVAVADPPTADYGHPRLVDSTGPVTAADREANGSGESDEPQIQLGVATSGRRGGLPGVAAV